MIAAWSLLTGGLQIGAAFSGLDAKPGWLTFLDGLLATAFGLALIAFPGTGILAIVWSLGLFAIINGAWMLVAAFRLRSSISEIKPVITSTGDSATVSP
jgi:uncharacterized membrane protein HdeD (DUF308 family)